MSEAFTDTTDSRAAQGAPGAWAAGRHRGAVARDDGNLHQPQTGHGRHRRGSAETASASAEF